MTAVRVTNIPHSTNSNKYTLGGSNVLAHLIISHVIIIHDCAVGHIEHYDVP